MRILFVGLSDNLHAARHIRQLDTTGWDLHFFSVFNSGAHPLMQDITLHQFFPDPYAPLNPRVRYQGMDWKFSRGREFLRKKISNTAWADPARRLAALIERLKPDLVHSMGIQHGGYIALDALKIIGREKFPRWLVSNWGSDIQFNGQFDDEAEKIREILALADDYTCECQRDVELARQYGFAGRCWPVLPNAGGLDLAQTQALRSRIRPSDRRRILIKGYQHWYGRALVAIKAIEMCADKLRNYKIGLYGLYAVGYDVQSAAHLVSRRTRLNIKIIPPCPHDEIMKLHAESRVSISLSTADGICTSFLEAAAAGAFPIQSNTSCANEWAEHGRSALFVDPDDPRGVAEALQIALSNDRLVDEAADINGAVLTQRLDAQPIRSRVIASYQRTLRGA